MRAIESEQGLLHRADGSARYLHGKSSVLVGVYGPLEAKVSKQLIDRACVEVAWIPKSGTSDYKDREKQLIIQNSLESVLITSLYPRSIISVIIQVMNDDGSTLSAAVNGVCLALLDAGLAMNSLFVSVSSCVFENIILLDPTISEELAGTAVSTFVFSSESEGLVTSKTAGGIDKQTYFKLLNVARQASKQILLFIRMATEQKAEKRTKN
jgi:exosome complex component RRP46